MEPDGPGYESGRRGGADRYAVKFAEATAVVVDTVVVDLPIVPNGNGTRLPVEASLQLWCLDQVEQQREQAVAGRARHVLDVTRVAFVDVDHLAAGLGVSSDDWYLKRRVRCARRAAPGTE